MTKDKVHVEEIFERSNHKSTPVLLKFQNGDLKNTNKDSTLYFPAKCESDNKKKCAVVVASGNVYTGPVSDGSKELVDTYVCVRNKTTNKVRIIPIDQVKLINNVYEQKTKTQFALLSKQTAQETAMRNFGGRKDLRYLNTKERNAVSIDVIRDQLEETVEKSEITSARDSVVSTEDVIDRIRPKCNKEATNLNNVYNIYDVIPLELMDRLDEEVSVVCTTDIDDIPLSSEYLKNEVRSLMRGPQSSQTLLKIKIILYMDALMVLLKTKSLVLSKIEISKITEKVENDIRDRFSAENSFQKMRSSTTNEKALCYFLVLGFLLSDDFELNMVTLSTELCMSKAKILKYGNLVNAVYKRQSDSLALRLPSTVKTKSFSYDGKRKRIQ